MIKSINPTTNKIIKEYKEYSSSTIESIINEVSEEYLIWKTKSFNERQDILIDISDALSNNLEEHAQMITL